MNAIVEVTTAEAAVEVKEIVVLATVSNFEVVTPVVTSTLHVQILSIGGCSISAVSPDNDFIKETALAGA